LPPAPRTAVPPRPAALDRDEAAQAARLRLAVGRLARQLRRRSGGLTLSQLSALASVELLEPVRLGDLAARECVAAPTVTRIAARPGREAAVRAAASRPRTPVRLLTTDSGGRRALRSVRAERTQLLAQRLEPCPPSSGPTSPGGRLLEALVAGDDG
jgi:DNA-binding MarR family transcriptional regulator